MSVAIPYAGDVGASHDSTTDFERLLTALTSQEAVLMRVVGVNRASKVLLWTGRESDRDARWLETPLH